ncbi:MAG: ATP synthase F1 subunit delta [Gemmataceae bacterium]|nr:ATP synthase F1 subunit delta [Gemmataceae bacterium]
MTTATGRRIRNVKEQGVAQVYAEALYNAAARQGKTELIREQLQAMVLDLFGQDPLLEKFLAAGSIRRDAKREAIEKAFRGRADDLLVDFLQVMNRHGRLNLLRAVVAAYRELDDERSGRIRVEVRAAVPLSAEQEQKLRDFIARRFQRTPMIETRIDPEVLGGMVIRVDDWVFDGSVKTKLERLQNQLMASYSYV